VKNHLGSLDILLCLHHLLPAEIINKRTNHHTSDDKSSSTYGIKLGKSEKVLLIMLDSPISTQCCCASQLSRHCVAEFRRKLWSCSCIEWVASKLNFVSRGLVFDFFILPFVSSVELFNWFLYFCKTTWQLQC